MSVPAVTPDQAAGVVRTGLLASACDRDGSCMVECGEVPPLDNCIRNRALQSLAVLEAQHRDAVRLLNRVVQADRDDALMGHPNPGDSCIAACIGLEVVRWLDEHGVLDRLVPAAGDEAS